MPLLVILGLGLILGIAVGRWWVLVAAIAPGVWIWSATDVDEVPHWFLGLMYATAAAVGIATGVLVRAHRSPS